MTKSPDAFRTISEVAEDLDLPQHVLRFWETRFSQIKPLKRGGGRRYYRPDDVLLLRGIKHLLYGEGYTIKGVQRILREQGLRYVMGLWQDEVSEPKGAGHASQDPEAYAPKPGRLRERQPLFEPGDDGPDIYAPASLITARRPNFEPIVDVPPPDDAGEDEEIEIEDDLSEDAEVEEESLEEDEDSESEEDEEDSEESDEEEEENEEEADGEYEEDEDSEDEEEDDEEEEEPSLSPEVRKKLEQILRELTALRHALDG